METGETPQGEVCSSTLLPKEEEETSATETRGGGKQEEGTEPFLSRVVDEEKEEEKQAVPPPPAAAPPLVEDNPRPLVGEGNSNSVEVGAPSAVSLEDPEDPPFRFGSTTLRDLLGRLLPSMEVVLLRGAVGVSFFSSSAPFIVVQCVVKEEMLQSGGGFVLVLAFFCFFLVRRKNTEAIPRMRRNGVTFFLVFFFFFAVKGGCALSFHRRVVSLKAPIAGIIQLIHGRKPSFNNKIKRKRSIFPTSRNKKFSTSSYSYSSRCIYIYIYMQREGKKIGENTMILNANNASPFKLPYTEAFTRLL